MDQRTPLYQLVEDRIEGTLADYVSRNRATKSWRSMAADLTEQAGVQVTYQTLVNWFGSRTKTTVTVADRPGRAS